LGSTYWVGEQSIDIGTSLILIAIGAILRYAITISVKGVVLPTVGLILMIVGIVGLVIALAPARP
jgi:hypothetical protein